MTNSPFSYSKVGTYQQCPAKFKYQYLDRIKIEQQESPQIQRGQRLHSSLEDHINSEGQMEMDPELWRIAPKIRMAMEADSQVEAEMEVAVTATLDPCGYDSETAWLRGIIDVAIFHPTHTATIYDLKTGSVNRHGTVYTDAMNGHLQQLKLYAALLFFHRNLKKVEYQALYVDAEQQPSDAGGWMVPTGAADIISLWNKRTGAIDKARTFPTRVNKFCNWCAFSKNNGGPCTAA